VSEFATSRSSSTGIGKLRVKRISFSHGLPFLGVNDSIFVNFADQI
jgi:hypothetical protein